MRPSLPLSSSEIPYELRLAELLLAEPGYPAYVQNCQQQGIPVTLVLDGYQHIQELVQVCLWYALEQGLTVIIVPPGAPAPHALSLLPAASPPSLPRSIYRRSATTSRCDIPKRALTEIWSTHTNSTHTNANRKLPDTSPADTSPDYPKHT